MQERLQMQETQFTMHESMYINVSEFSNVCSVTKFQHIQQWRTIYENICLNLNLKKCCNSCIHYISKNMLAWFIRELLYFYH